MWQELISGGIFQFTFAKGVSEAAMRQAEQALNLSLPVELRDVLRETDGIGREDSYPVIWPLERIVQENLDLWNDPAYQADYMPVSLLLIGDADEVIVCGYPLVGQGKQTKNAIFSWNRLFDSRVLIAKTLRQYLTMWRYANPAVAVDFAIHSRLAGFE